MLASAATQTTTPGRALSTLFEHQGRVYAGYGDYDANTGPIHLCSVDVADVLGAWTDHLTVDSEQIGAPVALTDGRLVVPHIDPRSTSGGYAQADTTGDWTDLPAQISSVPSDVVHVFDAADYAGSLWMCGSGGGAGVGEGGARVWRSTDGGATWTVSLAHDHGDDFSRFYGFAVTAAGLHVKDPTDNAAFRWNGSAWVDDGTGILPDGVQGGPGLAWRDGTVVPSRVADGQHRRDVYYFDGTASTLIASEVSGFNVGDDGALYMTRFGGATDSAFRVAPTGPVTAGAAVVADIAPSGLVTSLCVLPGSTQAVLGRSDSRVSLIDLA